MEPESFGNQLTEMKAAIAAVIGWTNLGPSHRDEVRDFAIKLENPYSHLMPMGIHKVFEI